MAGPSGSGPLDAAIEGSPRSRFLLEFLGNSAIFPIANILLEFFLEGGPRYFLEPDFYAIVAGALAQAAWLTSRRGERHGAFLGNLIGPAAYTAIETAVEGSRFFSAPHHLAYWGFSAGIGALQAWRAHAGPRAAERLLVAESVVRSSILFAMYWIYEAASGGRDTAGVAEFFRDPSHRFIALAVAMLGGVAGLAAVTSRRYLAMLRALSRRLRVYSEWLFGRALLEQAVGDPERLALTRRERSVVFMDVRGFTAWSETQAPEAVVAKLNDYYHGAEAVFARLPPVRFKFSADEVMAVFAAPQAALAAAHELSVESATVLAPLGLGAGVGVHWGPVVEGLVGGAGVKQYDVIGDTVNTAKRIEGAAGAGEILVSEAFRARVGLAAGETRAVEVKGKAAPLVLHRVRPADLDSGQAQNEVPASSLIV